MRWSEVCLRKSDYGQMTVANTQVKWFPHGIMRRTSGYWRLRTGQSATGAFTVIRRKQWENSELLFWAVSSVRQLHC